MNLLLSLWSFIFIYSLRSVYKRACPSPWKMPKWAAFWKKIELENNSGSYWSRIQFSTYNDISRWFYNQLQNLRIFPTSMLFTRLLCKYNSRRNLRLGVDIQTGRTMAQSLPGSSVPERVLTLNKTLQFLFKGVAMPERINLLLCCRSVYCSANKHSAISRSWDYPKRSTRCRSSQLPAKAFTLK